MIEITDKNILNDLITTHKPGPVNKLTSTNYPDKVQYECGCGKIHKVNDKSLKIFAISPIVKFYFICEKNYVSLVKISGFFSQKTTLLGTFKKQLLKDHLNDLGISVEGRL